MRIRVLRFVISALASATLSSGCAAAGSSVTQSAGTVPAAVQGGIAPGGASVARQAHSGGRRTLSVPTCSGSGTGSFVGGPGNATNGPNIAAGAYSVVAGGENNQACDDGATIAGGYGNAVSTTNGSEDGFIGGGTYNTVTGNSTLDPVVVGGYGNVASGSLSAVVGGEGNSAAAILSLVGGGLANTVASGAMYGAIVSGDVNNVSGEYGFIGAGLHNTVSGEGGYIAAGGYNTVTGEAAVIDGGFNATASGSFSTIPGGYGNSAGGTYSFAAGARANAAQDGAFVWSDGSDGTTVLSSTQPYQFLARASGGFTLYTNAASTVGAQLAAGSGTWASLSDRNVKTNIVPLDDTAVLEKVAALPISRWSYKSEHGVRHVGPMAQDFYAAFKVGEDDRHITSIDEDGVALAAIKALHAENGALRNDNETLHADNTALRRRLAADEAHVRRVEAQLARIVAMLRKE